MPLSELCAQGSKFMMALSADTVGAQDLFAIGIQAMMTARAFNVANSAVVALAVVNGDSLASLPFSGGSTENLSKCHVIAQHFVRSVLRHGLPFNADTGPPERKNAKIKDAVGGRMNRRSDGMARVHQDQVVKLQQDSASQCQTMKQFVAADSVEKRRAGLVPATAHPAPASSGSGGSDRRAVGVEAGTEKPSMAQDHRDDVLALLLQEPGLLAQAAWCWGRAACAAGGAVAAKFEGNQALHAGQARLIADDIRRSGRLWTKFSVTRQTKESGGMRRFVFSTDGTTPLKAAEARFVEGLPRLGLNSTDAWFASEKASRECALHDAADGGDVRLDPSDPMMQPYTASLLGLLEFEHRGVSAACVVCMPHVIAAPRFVPAPRASRRGDVQDMTEGSIGVCAWQRGAQQPEQLDASVLPGPEALRRCATDLRAEPDAPGAASISSVIARVKMPEATPDHLKRALRDSRLLHESACRTVDDALARHDPLYR